MSHPTPLKPRVERPTLDTEGLPSSRKAELHVRPQISRQTVSAARP